MQIRLTLSDTVLEILEKEAEKLGMDRNAYIQMVLGTHIQELKQRKQK